MTIKVLFRNKDGMTEVSHPIQNTASSHPLNMSCL